MEVLAAAAIAELGMQVKQSIDQKHAAKRAEEAQRAQTQLDTEKEPAESTNIGQSVVQKNDEQIPGLQGNILANSRRYSAPQAGDKTLLGQ